MVYLIVIIIVHSYITFVSITVKSFTLALATDDRRRLPGPEPIICYSVNHPNKMGCVHGLPASAARNDLTQPRTSSRYGLRLWALPWGYLPDKCLTPVNITHKLL